MKKLRMAVTTLALTLALGTTAFAAYHNHDDTCAFVDADQDGICDNYENHRSHHDCSYDACIYNDSNCSYGNCSSYDCDYSDCDYDNCDYHNHNRSDRSGCGRGSRSNDNCSGRGSGRHHGRNHH